MNEGTLLVIALATPLVMLAACLSKWARQRMITSIAGTTATTDACAFALSSTTPPRAMR